MILSACMCGEKNKSDHETFYRDNAYEKIGRCGVSV